MGLFPIAIILWSLFLVPNIWRNKFGGTETEKAKRMFSVFLPAMAVPLILVWSSCLIHIDDRAVSLRFAGSALMALSLTIAVVLDRIAFIRSGNAPVYSTVKARVEVNGVAGHFFLGLVSCAAAALILFVLNLFDAYSPTLRKGSPFWVYLMGTNGEVFALSCGLGAVFTSLGGSAIVSAIRFQKT